MSFISVISPIGSDFCGGSGGVGGGAVFSIAGCGVTMAVGVMCSDNPDKLVNVGSDVVFDCEFDSGGVVTVGEATGTADGAAGENRFQFGGGVCVCGNCTG